MARDRTLDSLAPAFLGLVVVFLARVVEAGIPILIVETRRSEEQHRLDLVTRHSWISHSLHQDGLAIDIAPWDLYQQHGDRKIDWDPAHPVWVELGRIGEASGLKWGGRWGVRDMGHFEMPR